jgi:hypothetical protein
MSHKCIRKHVETECKKKSVLLLEGSDDCNIIDKFCKDNAITVNFGFCHCGGGDCVLSKLDGLLRMSEVPEVIGIVLDADNNIDGRYQKIKDKIENFYKLPQSMPKGGLVHTEKKRPKLGIWIMPNNQDNGALEEFYLKLAPDIDTNFISDIIKQAGSKDLTSFKAQHKNKAIMHTYFAWQDKPGMPLHTAIDKIALNINEDIAKTFKDWLIKLF